jgi:hypothetical protein
MIKKLLCSTLLMLGLFCQDLKADLIVNIKNTSDKDIIFDGIYVDYNVKFKNKFKNKYENETNSFLHQKKEKSSELIKPKEEKTIVLSQTYKKDEIKYLKDMKKIKQCCGLTFQESQDPYTFTLKFENDAFLKFDTYFINFDDLIYASSIEKIEFSGAKVKLVKDENSNLHLNIELQ